MSIISAKYLVFRMTITCTMLKFHSIIFVTLTCITQCYDLHPKCYIVRQTIALHVKKNSRKRLITTQHSVYDIKNDDRLIGSVLMIKIR